MPETVKGEAIRRYELKYAISPLEARLLEARLSGLLERDRNARAQGGAYEIRSVYFDDACDTHLNEVQSGLSDRSKWRIRFYGFNDRYICLERKRKRNAMTLKESCEITRADMESLIAGRRPQGTDGLLRLFAAAQEARGYRPRAVIDYHRIPFIYSAGSVRITLDTQICCSANFSAPFERTGFSAPVQGQVLEVKYTDFLPDFIRLALQLNHLSPTSFSKYAAGRQALHYMTTGEDI